MTLNGIDEQTTAEDLIHSFDDFYNFYREDVDRIGRKVARDNRTVEADDLVQDLWVDLAETWEKILKASKFTVTSIIRRRALQLAAKERVDYMHFSGSYLYTPKDVRTILSESAWSDVEKAPDIEGRVDVRNKFDKLAPGRKAAVYKRYGLGFAFKEMTGAEQKALERGVTNITDWLNGSLGLHSVSYEAAFKDEYGLGDGLSAIKSNQRASEASNFLNGKD